MLQENDNIKEKVFRDHLSYLRSELEKTQQQLEIVTAELIQQRQKYNTTQHELQCLKRHNSLLSIDRLFNICKN